MADSNKRTRPGRKPTDEQFLFGTDSEVANRDNPSLYTEFNPTEVNTHFQQISATNGTGKSINRAPLAHKSGAMKFAGGPGVPGGS
jgi:hypothetical protein